MTAHEVIAVRPSRYLFSIDDFLLLHRQGSFADKAKAELIRGEIYTVNAQHSRHARAKTRLLLILTEALKIIQPSWEVLSEVTVRIAPDGAPEPDLVVTDYHGDELVPAETVQLVIEVADSTQKFDLGPKAGLYAAAGIPEYWVVDLERRVIHQLWAPGAERYGERREMLLGEPVQAMTIDKLAVETGKI
ncbi:Uma2 family endonuclease [Novosphingopyxis sp. YJ-S2-01]|uniref:Uma2 family endonuclease n=1 Tax=Novosphingopyxis sp. YJ-S2-01 TaxID=2794021 RepID=UPI0018DB9B85|nr:Uma2 family endonuclease [Novosphingopyxis sp. YJ-S2-01]MBH9537983.1 Uma2 family endonuclease [Novosphingopyxis sp. YJ-S2-01]